jgi:hypothetical protein
MTAVNDGLHSHMGIGNNHVLHNWVKANEAARTSATYEITDIGKEVYQADTKVFWRITDVVDGVVTGWDEIGGVSRLVGGQNVAISGYEVKAASYLSWNTSVTGVIPKLLGTVRLVAGSYHLSATFGCSDPAYTAYLLLKKSDATDVCNFAVEGIAADFEGNFTITEELTIYCYLVASDVAATAIMTGGRIL